MDFLPGQALSALLLMLLMLSTPVNAQVTTSGDVVDRSCFTMEWKRGKPFDYYHPSTTESSGTYKGGLLYLVERHHFTNDVRKLIKGSTAALPGDLLFVLNSIPNHPSALDTYSRYEYRLKTSELYRETQANKTVTHSADCLFLRANEIFPNNAETLLVWAIHQYRNNRFNAAKQILERAVAIAPDYIEAHYNLGLVYVELNDAEKARKHAAIAYDAGYPLMGLKNKIAKLKQH
ncbi:tetratricopeptide repeat protein [Arsukibacterium indicum]|uniref:Tetratricopeptide repeat protein n=1 Tax=Arsukibacterium indicum TaxID=2848612 RepID=A0ABS6MGC8_9GAMM|nr:tetratricopeptide repeat protein [Arsukibacterium indicum]MBV2127710.1 tetratricopeptide repeat protein [Arsukibacterium indicum]